MSRLTKTTHIQQKTPKKTPSSHPHAQRKKAKTELINQLPKRTRGQSVWTPERRARAAARARRNKPWLHSTGPRTAAGKAVSRYNGCIGAPPTPLERRAKLYMREQKHFLRGMDAYLRLRRAARNPLVAEALKDRLEAMHTALMRHAILLHLILPSFPPVIASDRRERGNPACDASATIFLAKNAPNRIWSAP